MNMYVHNFTVSYLWHFRLYVYIFIAMGMAAVLALGGLVGLVVYSVAVATRTVRRRTPRFAVGPTLWGPRHPLPCEINLQI